MFGIPRAVVACALPALWLVQTPYVMAQGTEQQVKFNHSTETSDRSYELKLSDGEHFTVLIERTCEGAFSYDVHGILRQEPDAGRVGIAAGVELKDKTIPLVHDARYGGYIVTIKRTLQTAVCTGGEKLQDRTLIIFTPQVDWDIAFSGGFIVSTLTNPVFSLHPHPTVSGKMQVAEELDKQDAANLGIGAFVHLYHRRVPWLGMMFGLGIREDNKTEYFLGGGYRFSDKATINAGLALGPVTRLPNGVNTSDPVDANALSTLPTRVKPGVFVALTYSFINVRNRLEQPFAGGTGSSGGAGGKQTATGCTAALTPASLDFVAAGEAKRLTITTTPETCSWKIDEKPAWITVAPDHGDGKMDVMVTAAASAGAARKEKLTISGGSVSVSQAAKP